MLPDRAFFDLLADAARKETLPRFRVGADVVNKEAAGFDPVTEGDRAAEAAIRALIEQPTRRGRPGRVTDHAIEWTTPDPSLRGFSVR